MSEHQETYRGCTIRLEQDEHAESPREWENVGTMVCWHRRYNLGDEQPKVTPDEYLTRLAREASQRFAQLDDLRESAERRYCEKDLPMLRIQKWWESAREAALGRLILLPLYLYDHSGITMSTGRFSCPWDSGQVGFIYCTLEKARSEWEGTDDEVRAKAEDCFRAEVRTYDNFLTGDVVTYTTETPDGEVIDSCGGFFPDHGEYSKRWDYPLGQARESIDAWCAEQDAEKAEVQYWAERDVLTV
jgi:hypothetical protein